MREVYGFHVEPSFARMGTRVFDGAMTLLPSLLHADLVRERSREGRRRATGAQRLVRPALPPAAGAVRGLGEDDDGGRCAGAPATVAAGC